MGRLIFIICAIAGVWLLLQRTLKPKNRTEIHRNDRPMDYAPTERCSYCGAYGDRRVMQFDEHHGYHCREHDV